MQISTNSGNLHNCGGMTGEILTVDMNAHSYRITVEICGPVNREIGGRLVTQYHTAESFEILINRESADDLSRYLVINLEDPRGALAKYLTPCDSEIDGAVLFARNLARKAIDALSALAID